LKFFSTILVELHWRWPAKFLLVTHFERFNRSKVVCNCLCRFM